MNDEDQDPDRDPDQDQDQDQDQDHDPDQYPDATSRNLPYKLRGRVQSAIFNCPRCNQLLVFRARTAFGKLCPICSLQVYVFLRVCVSRHGTGPGRRYGLPPGYRLGDYVHSKRARVTNAAIGRRPPDTILPTSGPDRIDPNTLQLDGDPNVKGYRARILSQTPPSPVAVDLIDDLRSMGASGRGVIESMPEVGVGLWTYPESAHRLVDLDAEGANWQAETDTPTLTADALEIVPRPERFGD